MRIDCWPRHTLPLHMGKPKYDWTAIIDHYIELRDSQATARLFSTSPSLVSYIRKQLHIPELPPKPQLDHKICARCKIDKPRSEYYRRIKGPISSRCKACSRRGSWTLPEKEKARQRDKLDRESGQTRSQQHSARRYRLLTAAKDVPCADCKQRYPAECMDFDHVSGSKVKHVGGMRTHSLDRLLVEISKCEVVCSNCHRIRTRQRRDAAKSKFLAQRNAIHTENLPPQSPTDGDSF